MVYKKRGGEKFGEAGGIDDYYIVREFKQNYKLLQLVAPTYVRSHPYHSQKSQKTKSTPKSF
jgi:hypothetical protein